MKSELRSRWVGAFALGSSLALALPAAALPAAGLDPLAPLQAEAPPGQGAAPREAASESTRSRGLVDFGLPDLELFLRAGRATPPGLTATRARERDEDRAAALATLGEALALDSADREAWLRGLAGVLESPAAGADLWIAAARIVAALRLYELEPPLVRAVAGGGSATLRAAAIDALRLLYGERPDLDAEFVRPFEPSDATDYLLDRLLERDARVVAGRRALFESDPARALEALGDPDPAVRRAAAATAGAAAVDGRLDPATVRAALVAALEDEVSARAFHAQLSAALSLVEGLPPDATEVAELRLVVLRRAGEATEPLLLSLAHGVARLPWVSGTERPEINRRAAARQLARLLARVAERPHPDTDVLAGVLGSLDDLLSVVEAEALARARHGSVPAGDGVGDWVRGAEARLPLLSLLQRSRTSDGVRRSVAETLGRVATADDLSTLLEVLRSPDSGPGLRYALLGTLGTLAIADASVREPVVQTLFEHLDDADADLRRRALTLLSVPELAEQIGPDDADRLVRRLGSEPVREFQGELLRLARRHGTRETLDGLLALPNFDELAAGEPARGAALADTLGVLAGDDGEALFAAAGRLADVNDLSTAISRFTSCLELVARLDDASAAALRPEDNDRIVIWARRVRSARGPFVNAFEDAPLLVQRIVDVHVPGLGDGGGPSAAERQHTRALFLGDLAALGEADSEGAAFESFAAALALAEETEEIFLAARVRRDRARFALERDRDELALGDLRELARAPDVGEVLDLSDLRALASLLLRPTASDAPTEAGRAPNREAATTLLTLVRRGPWIDEPAAVRLRDLQNLGSAAIASRDPELLRAVRDGLAGLPDEVVADEDVVDPDVGASDGTDGNDGSEAPVCLWAGLERGSDSLGALRQLAQALASAAAATPVAAEPASSPPAGTTGEGVDDAVEPEEGAEELRRRSSRRRR